MQQKSLTQRLQKNTKVATAPHPTGHLPRGRQNRVLGGRRALTSNSVAPSRTVAQRRRASSSRGRGPRFSSLPSPWGSWLQATREKHLRCGQIEVEVNLSRQPFNTANTKGGCLPQVNSASANREASLLCSTSKFSGE